MTEREHLRLHRPNRGPRSNRKLAINRWRRGERYNAEQERFDKRTAYLAYFFGCPNGITVAAGEKARKRMSCQRRARH